MNVFIFSNVKNLSNKRGQKERAIFLLSSESNFGGAKVYREARAEPKGSCKLSAEPKCTEKRGRR